MNRKEIVGRKAADYVEDGMVVGLGTGTTAYWFVEELGQRIKDGRLQHIIGVPTSKATKEHAQSLGIPLSSLDDVTAIDVLVDGADECTRQFQGIKGGGGAHLIEKIVAQNAHKVIWIVTSEKLVDQLGQFPLPIEIVQTGAWKLFRTLDQAGFKPTFRKKGPDSLFVTDSGNYIIDLHLGAIPNPTQLAFELNNLVGLVEHGLFLNYAQIILSVDPEGQVEVLEKQG